MGIADDDIVMVRNYKVSNVVFCGKSDKVSEYWESITNKQYLIKYIKGSVAMHYPFNQTNMEYSEIYNIIRDIDTTINGCNCTITTNSGKKYRQNIYISSANRLKIRNTGSKVAGYNITSEMAKLWKDISISKKRVKKS